MITRWSVSANVFMGLCVGPDSLTACEISVISISTLSRERETERPEPQSAVQREL